MTSPYHGEFEIASEKECLGHVGRESQKFSAPGNCVLLSAPVEAKPGDTVVIVVARKLQWVNGKHKNQRQGRSDCSTFQK